MSDTAIENLKIQLQEAGVLYSNIRELVIGVSDRTKAGDFSKEQLCDIGFLLRELVTQCEEIRKDLGATKVLVDKIMCVKAMAIMLSTQSGEDVVHGDLASGKPHYKKSVTLPKKDTPEYENMCKHFGVTSEGIELGVAKISWKKVCSYITELAELGKPLPDFIPKIHDDYTVIHRRKSM